MASGDLHRDLGGGIGPAIAGAVNAPGVGEPVALGQHADRLRPARIGGIGPVGGDVPLVRPKRSAARRARVVLGRTPARTAAHRSSSERSSLGNVGVPVLPAIQSICVHVRASNTCSHASRAVPARWLKRQPADDHLGGVARDAIRLARRPDRSQRQPASVAAFGADAAQRPAPDAARVPPTGRSPPRRASPSCPRRRARSPARAPVPSLRPTTIDHDAAAAFPQSSLRRAAGRRRPAAHWRSFAGSSASRRASWNRRPQLSSDRFGQQATVGNSRARARGTECVGAQRLDRAPEQQIALAAIRRSAARNRRSSRTPSAIAWIAHGRSQRGKALSAQNMRSRKRAEVGAHRAGRASSRADGSAVGDACDLGALARQPARADRRIGEERRGHDRLDRRARHCVVEHGRVQQRVGPIADRIRQALVAVRWTVPGPSYSCARARRRARPASASMRPLSTSITATAAMRTIACSSSPMPDRARPRPPCADVERATDVVASGVARGRLLRERLQRRIDREVDREADVDRCAADIDPVRTASDSSPAIPALRRRGGTERYSDPDGRCSGLQRLQHRRRATAAPSSARRRRACREPARRQGECAARRYARCRRRCRASRRACTGDRRGRARRRGNRWRRRDSLSLAGPAK